MVPGTVGYNTEPAPMGVVDYGLTPGMVGYNYTTYAFLGTIQLRSLMANSTGVGNVTGFQLNSELPLYHNGSTAVFWVQSCIELNASSGRIVFLNAIWNFSASSQLYANSLVGNGTIVGFYNYDPVAGAYPGDAVDLRFPVNISLKVVNSVISGVPHIGFAYDDGYGWITYDNVTIPWATSWVDSGFLVSWWSGPYHGYFDAEFDYAGYGSFAIVTNIASEMALSLEYFNGHNFQAVLNAWNCGFNTGERAINVVTTAVAGPSPGLPAARITAGAGTLGVLYGRSDVAVLNVTTSVRNATLLVNGGPVAYRGDEANLTLFPGSYDLELVDGTTTLARRNVSLSGAEYLAISLGPTLRVDTPAPSRSSADVGQTVRFTTNVTLGLGGDVYNWSGLPKPCARSVPAPTCTFQVAGNYSITVTVSDSNGLKVTGGPLVYVVYPDPSVSSPVANRTAVDVGQSVGFAAMVEGVGAGSDTLLWGRGGTGIGGLDCAGGGAPATTCTARAAGVFTVLVTLIDRNGVVADATSGAVRVSVDPSVSAPSVSIAPIYVGTYVTLNVTASGGDGNYSYAWSGVAGAGNSSTVACQFTETGIVNVGVVVTDGNGFATASSINLTVLRPIPQGGPSGPPKGGSARVSSSGVDPTLAIGVIAIAALAGVGGVVLVLRRRRRPPSRPGP